MDLVVPAFAQVKKRYPDTRLVIVGDGSLRVKMQRQVQECDCTEKCRVGRSSTAGEIDGVVSPHGYRIDALP